MFCLKFAFLVPAVFVIFWNSRVQCHEGDALIAKKSTIPTSTSAINFTSPQHTKEDEDDELDVKNTTKASHHVPSKELSSVSTTQKYVKRQFGSMLKRLLYVTLVLSVVIGFYFLVKFCYTGRRKPRKYGVVKTPGDMEMRPLESDDDDDDITMFNRKD